jgi:hypothetical protein
MVAAVSRYRITRRRLQASHRSIETHLRVHCSVRKQATHSALSMHSQCSGVGIGRIEPRHRRLLDIVWHNRGSKGRSGCIAWHATLGSSCRWDRSSVGWEPGCSGVLGATPLSLCTAGATWMAAPDPCATAMLPAESNSTALRVRGAVWCSAQAMRPVLGAQPMPLCRCSAAKMDAFCLGASAVLEAQFSRTRLGEGGAAWMHARSLGPTTVFPAESN